MEFEYDPVKSQSNKLKHGIDFDAIQELWLDQGYVQVPARTIDEPRFIVIGRCAGKTWSCIITYRAQVIRIISARRARLEEVELYERERL